MHNPAEAARLHPGQHRTPEQHRTLDEEAELGQVAPDLGSGASGCGPVALSTSSWIGPRRSPTAATNSPTYRSSVTSAGNAAAAPLAARMSATTSATRPSPDSPFAATAKLLRPRKPAAQ
jgi:hypothetical protein